MRYCAKEVSTVENLPSFEFRLSGDLVSSAARDDNFPLMEFTGRTC